MIKHIGLLVAAILSVTAVHAVEHHVVVPETSWPRLLRYLEANLRVERTPDGVRVGTSALPYERRLFEPFDDALGEFANVLLVEGMSECKIQKLVDRVTREIAAEGIDVAAATPDELAAAYWARLAADDRFMGRLQALFDAARSEGRLACSICSEGFEPRHLEVR